MDLGAYANIERLEEVARKNGIVVPRLRGYRLMKEEKPVCIDSQLAKDYEVLEDMLHERPMWCVKPQCRYKYGREVDRKIEKYIDKDAPRVRYERMNRKKRNQLKLRVKHENRDIIKQFEMFNKYVGQDILYAHARIGAENWDYYKGAVLPNPRLIEYIEDPYDSTYMDLYFKID